jgi:hypothetical protein
MHAHGLLTTGLVMLGVFAGSLMLTAAPALAAAPEAPVTEAPTANTTGTTATLNGELNPGLVTEKVTYHFAYSAGSTAACAESGLTAPGEPFPEAEGNHKKVSTPVTGLEGSATYAVCLVASNPEGETTGTPQTFKTPASKPVVESQSVSGVTPLDATLEGSVNPESQETTYHLEFATNSAFTTGVKTFAYGVAGPGTSSVQPLGPVDIGGGLTPNTTYYYRVVAKNASGETKGTVEHPFEQFTTETLKAPSIDGESVTGVTQTNVELHAVINPEYQETEYQFKLGTSVAYGVDAPAALTVLGGVGFFGDIEPGVNLNGEAITLAPNTEYHYQSVATNATGTVEGLSAPGIGDKTFLTLPNPPTVLTGEASSITTNSAEISGTVNPGSSGHSPQDDTTYYFQYGPTMSYGAQAPGDAGEGTSPVIETANLSGLEPGVGYYYRIVATNDNTNTPQTTYGEDQTFTTLSISTPPILSGVSVSGVTQSSATITATLDPQGLPTRYELQLGSTPGLLQAEAFGNTAGVLPLTLTVGSLSPGTLYYYKLIATSLNGTSEPEGTFTTAPGPGTASSPLAQPPTPPLLAIPVIAFPAKTGTTTKTTTKALTRAQKLAAALKACRTKSKGKRAGCKRRARKQYASAKAGARKKHNKQHQLSLRRLYIHES